MNQRIRQLAELAGAVFEKTNGLNDCPQDSLVDDEIQKFAELIIEECARRCDVVRENNGGDKQFGARLCADEIRYLNRRS